MSRGAGTMRRGLRIAVAALCLALCGTPAPAQSPAPPPPRFAPLPVITATRLYVINCGFLVMNRPENFGLTREEIADTNMSNACFLVMHPKGILLFDTGLSDALIGRPVYEN